MRSLMRVLGRLVDWWMRAERVVGFFGIVVT